MNTSFLEWMKAKELLIEEGYRHQADYQVEGYPNIGDVVISNPAAFFKAVMYVPRGVDKENKMAKLRGTPISPNNFSSFNIASIDGNTIHSVRKTTGTYASKGKGADKLFHIKRLRDVTDSFQQNDLIDTNSKTTKYFVDLGRGKTIEELYKTYQQLTRHSVIASPEARQDAAMANILAGDEPAPYRNDGRTAGQQATANLINKGSNAVIGGKRAEVNEKIRSWMEDPQGYMGRNTGKSIDQIAQELEIELKSLHEDDPRGSAEIDRMAMLPYIHSSKIGTLHPLHSSHAEKNIEVRPKPTGLDAIFNQPQQRSVNPAIAPRSTPDEKMAQLLKTASYDPSIMSHTRHWKRHNDIKRYSYYCE